MQVAGHRRFADQQPHAVAQTLESLFHGERLVVRADARRRVGVQLLAEHARRMSVDLNPFRQAQLVELARVAMDDARKVHHLGEPEHSPPSQQALEVTALERSPG